MAAALDEGVRAIRMTASSPVNVLIVDDNASQRLSLSALLSDLDIDIVEASSGREALRHLLERDFALILLDVNMPGLDGFETAALIRARHRSEQTPIIFITANSDDAHAARGYSLRAVDFIIAPVQPDVLHTKVAVLIDLCRKTEEVARQREALWRYANQLQQLSRASLAINSTQSVDAVLRTMTDSAAQIIGAHQGLTVARLTGGRTRCVTHLADRYRTAVEARVSQSVETTLALDLPQALRVNAGEGQSALAQHPPRALFEGLPIRDWLAAPLHGVDGRFGLIQLAEKEDGPFTAQDEDILVQLTQMASIAIGNIMTSEAREANRLKDEFLSVLSHELRTPLQAMLTWLSILRREDVAAQMVSRGLDVIERSARAQAQLIGDLLDVSRIIRGKLRLESDAVELCTVIELAIETLKPAAAAKSVQIDFMQTAAKCQIIGDAARLQQVVWNLLSNAIKFTPAGGRVEVSLETHPTSVRLLVSDTGPGIPEEFLPHVFERFRQADSSTRRVHGGLGLGLAIVRHLVELHAGTVEVENRSGGGARFSVTLPRAPLRAGSADAAIRAWAETALQSAHGQPLNKVSLDGIRVVLVEDEIEARESMTTALQLYGAEVVAVDSTAAALAAMEHRSPDVLLSDIGMPKGDGYSLIEQIRARETAEGMHLPAAALTAYVRPEDRSEALRAGFDVHLSKPIEPPELARAVKRLAGARKQGSPPRS